jgi:hypothetical protein
LRFRAFIGAFWDKDMRPAVLILQWFKTLQLNQKTKI